MLTRRGVLGVGLGAAVVATTRLRASIAGGGDPALREIGRSKGIDIGSAYSGRGPLKYREILATHCEVLTPENQLKPSWVKPTKDSPYLFGDCDQIAEFCTQNGQKLHGHTLYWYQRAIRWAESDDFETVKTLYGGFIRDVVGHYPQAVSWDVFNEIVEENTRFRNDFLIGKFGYDFIDFCFRTANESSPGARLVINDFNFECAGDWCRKKRDNMIAVLKRLKSMKTPVHVVGIQGHVSSKDDASASAKSTLQFIERVADLGCDVYLSEVDVNDSQWPEDIDKRDALVARYYETYLTPVLSHKAVKRLTFWGISDSANWIALGGATWEPRTAGTPRPALFDSQDNPKPAFDAVVRALTAAPART
jgi:endo-1,4-beta-xylanase